MKKLGDDLTKKYAYPVAVEVASIFNQMLRPGGTQNIGVTGKASKNFYIDYTKGDWPGKGTYNVVEGDDTVANKLIREGIKPHVRQDIRVLRLWAATKGIRLQDQDTSEITVKPYLQTITAKYKSGKVSKYARSRAGKKEQANKALYKMRSALWASGTDRAPADGRQGAAWFPKFPKGKGRFDYVVYMFSRPHYQSRIEQAGVRATDQMSDAVIGYLGGGRKRNLSFRTSHINFK